jgi:serine/threonine protein phosphatase 1
VSDTQQPEFEEAPRGGRTLAIGDVHGCGKALATLLELVRPNSDDLVVALGDFVDRGPQSRESIDMLLELEQRCSFVALLGNHEEMMLDAVQSPADLTGWLMYGGLETLFSYKIPPEEYTLDRLPPEHVAFLTERCRDYFETETLQFVHAGFDPQLPLAQQPANLLRWEKLADRGPHRSGKITICGHTRQESGEPLDLGHTICIDTWVYGAGWLTCLDVESKRYWQANQKGESREGSLA